VHSVVEAGVDIFVSARSFFSGAYGALIVIPVAHMGDHRDVGRRTGMQGTILALGALAGGFSLLPLSSTQADVF